MKNARFAGHVHLFGITIVLVAALVLYLVWDWNKKLALIEEKTRLIEHKLESLDAKIKLLELQNEVRQAGLIKPTPALR